MVGGRKECWDGREDKLKGECEKEEKGECQGEKRVVGGRRKL